MINAATSFLIAIAAGIKAEDRIKEVIESLDLDGLNGPTWIVQELVEIWKASGAVALQPIQRAFSTLANKVPAFEDYEDCIGPRLLVSTDGNSLQGLHEACRLMDIPVQGNRRGTCRPFSFCVISNL